MQETSYSDTQKMQKTRIEWCDFSANPIDGLCLNKCFYCYEAARRHRFHLKEKIIFHPDFFNKRQANNFSKKYRRPARIFVGSTHEIFGNWILKEWIEHIINVVRHNPEHLFIFLSKNPERYASFDFPDNCWLGATVICKKDLWRIDTMRNIGGFISIEPLLEDISDLSFKGIKWIIIGAMTGRYRKKYQPKIEWIKEILRIADREKRPVFMKNNLKPYWQGKLRQEFPIHLQGIKGGKDGWSDLWWK